VFTLAPAKATSRQVNTEVQVRTVTTIRSTVRESSNLLSEVRSECTADSSIRSHPRVSNMIGQSIRSHPRVSKKVNYHQEAGNGILLYTKPDGLTNEIHQSSNINSNVRLNGQSRRVPVAYRHWQTVVLEVFHLFPSGISSYMTRPRGAKGLSL